MDNYKYLKVFYNDKLVGTLAKYSFSDTFEIDFWDV